MLNHDKLSREIKTFLAMSDEEINLPSQWSTARSKRNVGTWRSNRFWSIYKDDIKVIEQKLEQFLFNRDK